MKRIQARFFAQASGNEPVRDWLKNLSKPDRQTVGEDIATAEFGRPVGMPVCRPLGHGLYEVRSDISDGRIARVIFSISGDTMILLHGFVKKSQKTPKPDLDLAMRRLKEIT